jgi:cytochrome d ubiquinol oxidase subunit II
MPFHYDLQTIWFLLIGGLLSGYAILDGFDLGTGALHLFAKGDLNRRIFINAIGPVWDGNEVWLVTGGGALFAAFPDVYAASFSGFYSAFMLLLCALIFRAVAIEFRSKNAGARWRRNWDIAFSVSSIFIAFLMGVAIGNLVEGVPLNANREFAYSLPDMLNPYAILVGITTVALFMMHAAIYLAMKTSGDLQKQLRGWINNTIIFFLICYATTTMATLVFFPHMAEPFKQHPWLFLFALLNMLAIANIPREIHRGNDFYAFLSSSAGIGALLFLFALGSYPNLLIASTGTKYSLTIYSAASSAGTLTTMLYFAVIGIPFVVAYTLSIYYIFRGKVKIDEMSY